MCEHIKIFWILKEWKYLKIFYTLIIQILWRWQLLNYKQVKLDSAKHNMSILEAEIQSEDEKWRSKGKKYKFYLWCCLAGYFGHDMQ